jgi:hypothetical protein
MSTDYLPTGDSALLVWTQNFITYATDNAVRMGIDEAVIAPLTPLMIAFSVALAKTKEPNRGKVDTENKNKTRAVLKSADRAFVKAYILYNPKVTDADKLALGVHVHDTEPTHIPTPDVRPVVTVHATGDGTILVEVEKPWPPHAKSVKYFWEITDVPDPNPANLRHSTFKNKLKHEFVFEQPDWGKNIHFACAFENGKGDSGPLSAMVSTIVP